MLAAGVLASGCSSSDSGTTGTLTSVTPPGPLAPPVSESNPFGPNVRIFSPDSPGIQEEILRIYSVQGLKANEFIQNRYALLFHPGQYNLDVRVGYYTQVAGLGDSPDDVTITGAVRTQDNPATKPIDAGPGALDNFWRMAENLSIVPTLGSLTVDGPSNTPDTPGGIPKNQNVWAVSQAAPLRRIHVKTSPVTLTQTQKDNAIAAYPPRKRANPQIAAFPTTLRLFDLGWSSGGFMADTLVEGNVESGSQQQWMSRNCRWENWNTVNWNMVYLGALPVPPGTWPGTPTSDGDITDGGPTPVIREKPFITSDASGNFFVRVPGLRRNVQGVSWNPPQAPGVALPLSDFRIVKPADNGGPIVLQASELNTDLAAGRHLLFTPGVYYLNGTLEVNRANTIVLGMGLATLVANDGQALIRVGDVDGVSIAGLTLEAGPQVSSTLLEVGPAGSRADHSANPTFLYDIFARVGGEAEHAGRAVNCVTINSNDVVGDNLWLWRADHGSNVGWTVNTADSGLIVNGADVKMYGLAVEHFQKYQTVWNGERGRLWFYQSECPYDIPSQAAWNAPNGRQGYASYKVADNVSDHQAKGLGVYCFFRDAIVRLQSAIEVPAPLQSSMINMTTFWLDGLEGSEITHILNDLGKTVTKQNRQAWLPE